MPYLSDAAGPVAAEEGAMTTEDRLAEIYDIWQAGHYGISVGSDVIKELLELVEQQQEYVDYGVKAVRELQERVRELESRCTHIDLCPHCGV